MVCEINDTEHTSVIPLPPFSVTETLTCCCSSKYQLLHYDTFCVVYWPM